MKIRGTFVDQISGSIAGITGSRNRGGQYLRRRATPTNPNSLRQADVRNIFSGLVSAWTSTLSTLQRQQWRDYAAAVPRTDTIGNTIFSTGQQAYIGANTPRLLAGLPRIDAGPEVFNTGENVVAITAITVDSPTEISVTATLSAPASAAGDCLLFLGAPQNPSRNFFKGPYQYAGSVGFAAAATTAVFAELVYQSATTLEEGMWIPYRLRCTFDDGRLSTVFEGFTSLVAD